MRSRGSGELASGRSETSGLINKQYSTSRQLSGRGLVDDSMAEVSSCPMRPAQKRLVDALLAPVEDTVEGQYRRRDAAINAVATTEPGFVSAPDKDPWILNLTDLVRLKITRSIHQGASPRHLDVQLTVCIKHDVLTSSDPRRLSSTATEACGR